MAEPNPNPKPKPDTAELHAMGFQLDSVSPSLLAGRLPVTARCCQPFRVLHGGVSALVSEGLASMGAHMAAASPGCTSASATSAAPPSGTSSPRGPCPSTSIGRSTQLWEVDPSSESSPEQEGKKRQLIAESRVTLLDLQPARAGQPPPRPPATR